MKRLILFFIIIFSFSLSAHQWHEMPKFTDNDLLSVSVPKDSIAWICGKSGSVFLTVDAGNTWMNLSNNPSYGSVDLVHIFGVNESMAFVIANGTAQSEVFRTTDQGLNWVKVLTVPGAQGNSVYMFDTNRGAFIGNPVNGKWQIWLTNDGGVTWDSTGVNIPAPSPGEVSYINGLFGFNPTRSLMFGSNNSRYFISKDFGKTWEAVPVSIAEIHSISFADSLTGVIAGTGLLKTRDGGKTWKDNSSLVPGKGIINTIISHDFWHVFLTRTGDGITDMGNHVYHSSNLSDSHWDTSYNSRDMKAFDHITQARKGGFFYGVRQNGGITIGVHSSEETTGVSDNPGSPEQYSLSQNFPNPFNPATNIKYSLPQNSFVTLNVYDVLGKVITTLVNEEKPAGIYTINFNASELPSGLYIYEIRSSAGFALSRKMLLLK